MQLLLIALYKYPYLLTSQSRHVMDPSW